MAAHAVDVNDANFDQEVMEASRSVPVLVDFWAPWCAPCRQLTPVLEKVVAEYGGRVKLAKINSDQNQQLAVDFGVRGIPAVKLVVNGRLVDEFSGAIPESALRQFLSRWVPSASEATRLQAIEAYAAGDSSRALALLAEASRLDPANERVRVSSARILVDQGRHEEAAELIKSLGPDLQEDAEVLEVKAALEFAAGDPVDTRELEARVAADPDDLQARIDLANQWVAARRYEPALEQLLEVVRRDRTFNDEAGRKTMVQVFNLLGGQGPLVSRYRRALATLLN